MQGVKIEFSLHHDERWYRYQNIWSARRIVLLKKINKDRHHGPNDIDGESNNSVDVQFGDNDLIKMLQEQQNRVKASDNNDSNLIANNPPDDV